MRTPESALDDGARDEKREDDQENRGVGKAGVRPSPGVSSPGQH